MVLQALRARSRASGPTPSSWRRAWATTCSRPASSTTRWPSCCASCSANTSRVLTMPALDGGGPRLGREHHPGRAADRGRRAGCAPGADAAAGDARPAAGASRPSRGPSPRWRWPAPSGWPCWCWRELGLAAARWAACSSNEPAPARASRPAAAAAPADRRSSSIRGPAGRGRRRRRRHAAGPDPPHAAAAALARRRPFSCCARPGFAPLRYQVTPERDFIATGSSCAAELQLAPAALARPVF